MSSLEIKPEDIRPIDRRVRERLMRKPVDYIHEIRAILAEFRGISDKIAELAPLLREIQNLLLAETATINMEKASDIKLGDILQLVSKHFNVSGLDLKSARRTAVIVLPRHIAMYLSKTLTPRSLPEIGRFYGDRDHTTVLSAVRRIERLIDKDQAIAEQIAYFSHSIRTGSANGD